MGDDSSFYQTRQRGGSSAGKPAAPARPAPIFPPPPATAAPYTTLKAVVTPPTSSYHPPKPPTPAPAPSTPSKILQPAGTSKSPPNSPPSPLLSKPETSQTSLNTRPVSMSTISKPPAHTRQVSEIPPPPPEEEEQAPNIADSGRHSNGHLSSNDSELRKHRLSTGMVVKGPREWQQRWVSLQGRHMLAGKRGCEHPIDIPVQGSIVVSDASDLKQPRFAVLSANGQLCYYFLSLSQGDRSQWLNHLIEQGATVITPPIADSPNEGDSKGWLKVLSPMGTNPTEIDYLDGHVQRILEENNVRREAESLKLEAQAGSMSQIELSKIKMKVSKLEADNSQMNSQLAKQKKHIADLEARNSALLLNGASAKEVPLRSSISSTSPAVFPSSVRRKTVDEDARDPSVLAKDRIITDLQATNTRLQAEIEVLRAQVSQDNNAKQTLTTERDEALDLVEMVEKAKLDVEQAAEELLAQLTREKQDCEKTLRQVREDLSNLQQKQIDEGHRLRQAEESLTAQANFEASAEELIAELTKAKEQSDEKVRRMEEMLHRQSAALSLPASTRQSIFVSPQLQPAQASAAELELMAEKMALLDEMCIQKEEYDELKQAYDALVAKPEFTNMVEEISSATRESVASTGAERPSEVSAVQSSQDLAAKWKQRLEQARVTSQKTSTEDIHPALVAQTMKATTPAPAPRTLPGDASSRAGIAGRSPGPPVSSGSIRSPSLTPVRSPSGSLTNSSRDVPRGSPSSSISTRPAPGGKPLDVNAGYSSTRTLPPSPASAYGRDSVTSSLRSVPPKSETFPSVAATVRSNSTSSTSITSTSNSAVRTTPASPPVRNTSIIDSRTRGKM